LFRETIDKQKLPDAHEHPHTNRAGKSTHVTGNGGTVDADEPENACVHAHAACVHENENVMHTLLHARLAPLEKLSERGKLSSIPGFLLVTHVPMHKNKNNGDEQRAHQHRYYDIAHDVHVHVHGLRRLQKNFRMYPLCTRVTRHKSVRKILQSSMFGQNN